MLRSCGDCAVRAVSLGVVLVMAATAAGQTTYQWADPAGGAFGEGGRWMPAGPPGPADTASFAIPAAYTVAFDGTYANDRLVANAGQVLLDLAGQAYLLSHVFDGDASVTVGDDPAAIVSARLRIAGGMVQSNEVHLGLWPGNYGQLELGAGAVWDGIGGHFSVGVGGDGKLILRDGAVGRFWYGFVGWEDCRGTVEVSGSGSLWDVSGNVDLARGPLAAGTLVIRDGATARMDTCRMAVQGPASGVPAAVASAVVEGPGSLWQVSADWDTSLVIGQEGNGSATVRDGGRLETWHDLVVGSDWGSFGTLTVSGPGSTVDCQRILGVGTNGTGQLSVADGATVAVYADFHIGLGGQGSAIIRGAGSQVLCQGWGGVHVAYYGEADLAVCDGASLADVNGHIAVNPGSRGDVVIDGAGSRWTSTGYLLIAGTLDTAGGTGTLTIRNHGSVLAGDASHIWPGGTVCLAGGTLAGGTMTNQGLIRGSGEVGNLLTNAPGGEIRAEASGRLLLSGANGDNEGLLSLQGGTMEFVAPLVNAAGGDILGRGALIARGGLTNHGDVALSSGITDVRGDVTNEATGRIIVSGRADVTFWDDVLNAGYMRVSADSSATFFGAYSGGGIDGDGPKYFEDDVTPGFSPAVVEFGGAVTFGPLARLEIELAEDDNSDPLHPRYDSLTVTGKVRLGGRLDLVWLPRAADPNCRFGGTYDVLVYKEGDLGGTFTVGGQLAAYFAGIEYAAELGGGWKAVRITLHDLVDGDADLDGLVGRSDLLAMKAAFGGSGADWFAGDFNFDGVVDGLDYLAYKDNYGRIAGGAVPEPATLALLGVGAAGLLVRRRRLARGRPATCPS